MTVPAAVAELARRNYSVLIKAMLAVSQVRVAELSGVSETQLSRMKDGDLERFCSIVAACNLVMQPRTFRAVDPDRLRALQVLARDSLDRDDIEAGAE